MLRKGAFIMRVRKVDSDAIKLYESSQVKFKTTGTIREVHVLEEVYEMDAMSAKVIENISSSAFTTRIAAKR